MTIGEELKKTRIMLGLTQAEMCEGAVSISFYSKVERGKSKININDLLKLLNLHQISLYDFFHVFPESRTKNESLTRKLISGFYNRDLKSLEKIDQADIKNRKLKLELQLIIASLKNKVTDLPATVRREMKNNLLQIGKWDAGSLFSFNLVMPLYDFDHVRLLMNSIFSEKDRFNLDQADLVFALANLEVSYLALCYQKNKQAECYQVIKQISSLPDFSDIFIDQLIAQYFTALLKNDDEKQKRIIALLKKTGMNNWIAFLPNGDSK